MADCHSSSSDGQTWTSAMPLSEYNPSYSRSRPMHQVTCDPPWTRNERVTTKGASAV